MKLSMSDKTHKPMIALMKKVYPDYTGRRFFLEISNKEFDCLSYWDDGSRTYYTFVTSDGNLLNLPESHPFEQHTNENRKARLKRGLACIKRTIAMGTEWGLTLMLSEDELSMDVESITLPGLIRKAV